MTRYHAIAANEALLQTWIDYSYAEDTLHTINTLRDLQRDSRRHGFVLTPALCIAWAEREEAQNDPVYDETGTVLRRLADKLHPVPRD